MWFSFFIMAYDDSVSFGLRDLSKRKRKNYLVSTGGLGNQLFIFAAAHYILSVAPDREVVIIHPEVLSSKPYKREFHLMELEGLCTHNIVIRRSWFWGIALNKFDQIETLMPRFWRKLNKWVGYIKAPTPGDISSLKTPESWKIARGFFQDIEIILETEKKISKEILELKRVTLQKLAGKCELTGGIGAYVGIHFRRGDFRENSDAYGILALEFYSDALNLEKKRMFASDDFELLSKLSETTKGLFLYPDIFSPLESFALLSGASKVYAANSTYSWWAALVCIWGGGVGVIPYPFYKEVNTPRLQHPAMRLIEPIYE